MSLVRELWELQEVELEAESLSKVISELELKLADNEMVNQAKEHLREKQANQDNLRKEERDIEWELEDIQHKVAAAQKDLYSGRINNPKELLSREQDMAGLKAKQDKLETKSLELMERLELAKGDLAQAEAELREAEAEKVALDAGLTKELETRKARLSELKAHREQLLTVIPQEALRRYHLVKNRKGQAVARIEQGKCCGCHMTLPAREIQEARVSRLIQCSSCGRLLYMP